MIRQLLTFQILLALFITQVIADEDRHQVRVYADIVGDLFHYGHVEYLKKAKEMGDILIVGVHGDEEVESYKRRPIMTLKERIRSVEACHFVDEILPNAPLHITADWICDHNIDIVVHGDDINQSTMYAFYGVPIEMGIFHLVPYTKGISTTNIIQRIVNRKDLVFEYSQ